MRELLSEEAGNCKDQERNEKKKIAKNDNKKQRNKTER